MGKRIVGQRIVGMRPLSHHEAEAMDVPLVRSHGPAPVLELEDGTLLIAVQDWEGNGGGALFGVDRDGDMLGDQIMSELRAHAPTSTQKGK